MDDTMTVPDTTTVVLAMALVICFVWIALMQVRMLRLQGRLASLTPSGIEALERQLAETAGDVRVALSRADTLDRRCDVLAAQLQTTVQHVGLVRFNPFRDTGGDQSFAIAFLDHDANGIVISSLHNRNDTRVFAKPVRGSKSPYTLSDEEHQAIASAIRQVAPGEDGQRLKELRSSKSE